MVIETDADGEAVGSALERPDFEGCLARHRRGLRVQAGIAAVLVVVGALLVIAAFTPLASGLGAHGWALWLGGLLVAATAAFPAREALEHRDRISGLLTLREEWQDLDREETSSTTARLRLASLVHRLYPQSPTG
jgi:hypothetical protein